MPQDARAVNTETMPLDLWAASSARRVPRSPESSSMATSVPSPIVSDNTAVTVHIGAARTKAILSRFPCGQHCDLSRALEEPPQMRSLRGPIPRPAHANASGQASLTAYAMHEVSSLHHEPLLATQGAVATKAADAESTVQYASASPMARHRTAPAPCATATNAVSTLKNNPRLRCAAIPTSKAIVVREVVIGVFLVPKPRTGTCRVCRLLPRCAAASFASAVPLLLRWDH